MKTFFTFSALLMVSLFSSQTYVTHFNKAIANRTGEQTVNFKEIAQWHNAESRVDIGGWDSDKPYFQLETNGKDMGDFQVKTWKKYKDYVIFGMEVGPAKAIAVFNWKDRTLHLNFVEAKVNFYFADYSQPLSDSERELAELFGY